MNTGRFDDQRFVFSDYIDSARTSEAVNLVVFTALDYMQRFYSKAMIPNFFRNQSKSRELFDFVVRQHSKSQIFRAPIWAQVGCRFLEGSWGQIQIESQHAPLYPSDSIPIDFERLTCITQNFWTLFIYGLVA